MNRIHLASSPPISSLCELLVVLSNDKCNVNEVDPTGRSALHIAAGYGKIEYVEALIARGGDLTKKDQQHRTPLDVAVESDHFACYRFIIFHSPEVKWTPEYLLEFIGMYENIEERYNLLNKELLAELARIQGVPEEARTAAQTQMLLKIVAAKLTSLNVKVQLLKKQLADLRELRKSGFSTSSGLEDDVLRGSPKTVMSRLMQKFSPSRGRSLRSSEQPGDA